MDLVNEWKEKELEGYKRSLQNWKDNLDKLHKEYTDLEVIYKEIYENYRKTHNGEFPQAAKGKFLDEEVEKAHKKFKVAKDKYFDYYWNSNRFFYEHGYSKDFEDRCKKEIDKHFKKLQAKVEAKIGTITKISNLGGDDYKFEGTEGNCKVEVILAGGYNIQRLHTRWIVKK